jgi:hypothetical protein
MFARSVAPICVCLVEHDVAASVSKFGFVLCERPPRVVELLVPGRVPAPRMSKSFRRWTS